NPRHYPAWVEWLESRCVPSTFKWVGNGKNSDWDNSANWQRVAGQDRTYPSTKDDVAKFIAIPPAGKQQSATVDIRDLTIGNLSLTAKNFHIVVAKPFFTVTGTVTQFDGVIEGSPKLFASLKVGNWDWSGGIVKLVDITVQNVFNTFPQGDAEDTH